MTQKKITKLPFNGVTPNNKPTPEQIAAEHYRAFSQQMLSIVQGCLYNLCQHAGEVAISEALVDKAFSMARRYMEQAGPQVEATFKAVMEQRQKEQEAEAE